MGHFLSGGDRTRSPSLGQGGVRFWSILSLVLARFESDISDSFRLNRLGQVLNTFGQVLDRTESDKARIRVCPGLDLARSIFG